jgi:hypothetical protein
MSRFLKKEISENNKISLILFQDIHAHKQKFPKHFRISRNKSMKIPKNFGNLAIITENTSTCGQNFQEISIFLRLHPIDMIR